MKCPTCKNIVDPGAAFCPNCGLKKPLQSSCGGNLVLTVFVLFCLSKLFGDKTPPAPPSTAPRVATQAPLRAPIQVPVPVENTAPAPLPSFVGLGVATLNGDTIKVLKGDVAVVVRLSAIAAPEMRQAFGPQAKRVLASLTFGQTLTVYPTAIDAYGGYTAWVFRGGVRLNGEMVRRGLAWRYDQYAKGDKKLLALQNRARARRVGLWRDARPVAPWLWNQTKNR